MSDHSKTKINYSDLVTVPRSEQVCAVFQEHLYRYYPHYRGKLTNEQWHQLSQLAKTMIRPLGLNTNNPCTDSAFLWQAIESNPLIFIYFRYQIERIQQSSGKIRTRGFWFSLVICGLGVVWSWGVNEVDPTLVHLGSFLVGFLGPMAQKGLEKIKENKQLEAQVALHSKEHDNQTGE